METTRTKTTKTAIAIFCILTLTLFAVPDRATAQSMTLCPYKIVLNALGNSETVQAVIPITLETGYMFSEAYATLSVGGEVIAQSSGARYCYVDDNLLVYFIRDDVYTSETLLAMAGSDPQIATVTGDMALVNADGEELTIPFTRTDEVLIVDPEKKDK
jgi:hypothetical protein